MRLPQSLPEVQFQTLKGLCFPLCPPDLSSLVLLVLFEPVAGGKEFPVGVREDGAGPGGAPVVVQVASVTDFACKNKLHRN